MPSLDFDEFDIVQTAHNLTLQAHTSESNVTAAMASSTLSEAFLQTEGATIAKLLEVSKAYDDTVATRLQQIFAAEPDRSKHGPILWALMAKEPGSNPPTVLAKRCGVYLQYYLIAQLCKSRGRAPWLRFLSVPDLCFLTAIAASGFDSARAMVDEIVEKKADWPAIQALHITQQSFGTFFHKEAGFCFSSCVKIIDQIWELWDFTEPKIIHGFITPHVSKKRLEARKSRVGTFIFRFDSSGSLTIDFVTGTGELASGKVEASALVSASQLLQVVATSPTLTSLVDSRQEFSDAVIAKDQLQQLLTLRMQKLAAGKAPAMATPQPSSFTRTTPPLGSTITATSPPTASLMMAAAGPNIASTTLVNTPAVPNAAQQTPNPAIPTTSGSVGQQGDTVKPEDGGDEEAEEDDDDDDDDEGGDDDDGDGDDDE